MVKEALFLLLASSCFSYYYYTEFSWTLVGGIIAIGLARISSIQKGARLCVPVLTKRARLWRHHHVNWNPVKVVHVLYVDTVYFT